MTVGLSSFYLKLIAVAAMLVDHVGMLMFPEQIAFRLIGRISFPIYCFLIVEGFYHTSNIRKYITRLAVFAVISEIPFNYLVSGTLIDIKHQNVFFTLLIGLLTIYGINIICNELYKSLLLVAGALAAILFMTDYSFYGVILIYIFYKMREKRLLACALNGIMSFLVGTIQGVASLAAIPILLYNGKKGPDFANSKMWKYAFYAVYPIHMIMLYIIARIYL